jgi:hypothetical protein
MTNGPTRDAVLAWLQARIGRQLTPAEQADVLAAARAEGDAADALMAAFAAEFNVDMAAWRPELHRDDQAALLQPGFRFAGPRPSACACPSRSACCTPRRLPVDGSNACPTCAPRATWPGSTSRFSSSACPSSPHW